MIIGIGNDLCKIKRIEDVLARFGARFEGRIFTKTERAYAQSKANPAASYAKRFAAKEALAKALSTKTTGHLFWQDVEVNNGASGKPYLILHGAAKARAKDMTPDGYELICHLSLTDEPPFVQAFVVIEARSLSVPASLGEQA